MQPVIRGILPATATPFDENGKVHHDALIRLMEWNLLQGADGFFLGGSTAECFLLTEKERIGVFEAASAFLDKTGLIAHVGAISTAEAIRYAKEAKRMGYRMIAATPPFYYAFDARAVADYYYDIMSAADLPMLIYNFPGNTGKPFDLSHPATRELFCCGQVAATKHTSMDLHQLERLRALRPDMIILNGYEETILPALSLGADGAIAASGNFAVPHLRKLYRAFHSGDMETARILQQKANTMMAALYRPSLPASIKRAVRRFGFDLGNPRKPFVSLTDEDAAALDAILDENLCNE